MRNLQICRPPYALLLVLLLYMALHGCARKSHEPAFNIPSLLGKRIDDVQVALKLAPAETPPRMQPAATAGEAYRTFKKDNWYVVVAYRPENGKVTNYTLATDAEGGALKDKERFLAAGMLREADPLYSIDFIEAPDTVFSYTGVRITPQPINHRVTFRLTGSEDVFYVTYSLRPASGGEQSKQFITVPPWEDDFTAATGAQLTLEATPSSQAIRRSATGPMQATVQILVDGKIAQEGKLSGLWARCAMEIEY